MKRFAKGVIMLCLCIVSAAPVSLATANEEAKLTPVEVFSRLPQFYSVALSPSGNRIAMERNSGSEDLAALMALALAWATGGDLFRYETLKWFIAFGMCLLALQKLKDLEAFSFQFLPYDLLSQRWVPYAYVYAFAEAFAGIGMLTGAFVPLVALVALFIGTEGAISVFKAVYIDKRELKCACVGGNSNVPLGFVSLTENLMMVGMALYMLLRL